MSNNDTFSVTEPVINHDRLPGATHDPLWIAGESIGSRLWLGSSMYPSPQCMLDALKVGQPGFVTASARRQTARQLSDNGHWEYLESWLASSSTKMLPNTAGCTTAKEAVLLANMTRELFDTDWIKLEVIGDDYTLQPDPFELLKAARELVDQGFKVLPYCTEDLVLCQRLLGAGCPAVMPWGAPIGTGRGLQNLTGLLTLRERLPDAVIIIDAGLGRPSQAAQALEAGFDAVLLNTAVARSPDPVAMASAFAMAVSSGRTAYNAGLMVERDNAQASTPVVGMPFWHQTP